MALSNTERERCRYHLGYLSVSPAPALAFGIPVPIQTMFLIESAMNLLLPEAMPRVRMLLERLDEIETKLYEGLDYLAADQVDDIKIRPDHLDQLEREYCRWVGRLSDEIGAPPYPGSHKLRYLFASGVGSIPRKR